jgi:hypothetical protein
MSFRPPRIRKFRPKRLSSPSSPRSASSPPHLFPIITAPHLRRERDTSHLQLPIHQPIFALHGNDYAHRDPRTHTSPSRRGRPAASEDGPEADAFWDVIPSDLPGAGTRQKKERQRNTWVEKVIPTLIQPYLTLLHVSNDFRSISRVVEPEECTCLNPHATVTLVCMFIQRKFDLQCSWYHPG